MKKPKIKGPNSHDFHDSQLLEFRISDDLVEIQAVVKVEGFPAPNKIWRISFKGVMRFEYEMTGVGIGEQTPIDIYDIYFLENSEEGNRWRRRLLEVGIPKDEANVYHMVLASSFYRGFGENENLEGIQILCRGFSIEGY